MNGNSAGSELGAEQKMKVDIWENDDVFEEGEKGVKEVIASWIVLDVEKHGDEDTAQVEEKCPFSRSICTLANDGDAGQR